MRGGIVGTPIFNIHTDPFQGVENGPNGPDYKPLAILLGLLAGVVIAHLLDDRRAPRRLRANSVRADVDWAVKDSRLALADAKACHRRGDLDCARDLGKEAREIADKAYRLAHKAPWPTRKRAEERASRAIDQAHDFLWSVFRTAHVAA
jgi:hypothetical protein